MKNPEHGGSYLKASKNDEPVFVSGTGRKQSTKESNAVQKILDKKQDNTSKGGKS